MKKPVITLDGPAGAGKSTVARQVAQRLGLRFLDTGAMYRAITWKAQKKGISDPLAIAAMARGTEIRVEPDRVTCDGIDVTKAIREPAVTAAIRLVADSPECRAELVRMQREIGKAGGLVTEGRDQGSVVFPDADFKFYVDAPVEIRARRRREETGGDLDEIRRAIEKRDDEDRSRKAGPLVKPRGAVVIDTSGLTLEEVVARILAAVGSP
ncbi:MAG TPA: (d)CMP kinase [Planctomycetota bacterium]|jgi:cytidylate kinase|nr:(d)CMP kinase [Planctomycetota bacterium]